MKITVFTSNQPRHISLINKLSLISDEVFSIQECNTVVPGQVEDFFKKSQVMQDYFSKVTAAEKKFFKTKDFLNTNVRSLSIKNGDLNFLKKNELLPALSSDIYVVFGSSFIKDWLVKFLIEKNALNIHMGLSPYYRGSSCNFWALYDNKPEYVGATIHLLSEGLDSGPILYHSVPKLEKETPFEFTMKSVLAAQESLVSKIKQNEINTKEVIKQSKNEEVRYTINKDFTDQVALEFLNRKLSNKILKETISQREYPELINPFFL
jgi:methionyl-tRNA formyltransferase